MNRYSYCYGIPHAEHIENCAGLDYGTYCFVVLGNITGYTGANKGLAMIAALLLRGWMLMSF